MLPSARTSDGAARPSPSCSARPPARARSFRRPTTRGGTRPSRSAANETAARAAGDGSSSTDPHTRRACARHAAAAQAALLRGMTLCQDDRLTDATREDFRAPSLAHVLARAAERLVLAPPSALAWSFASVCLAAVVLLALIACTPSRCRPVDQRAGDGCATRRGARWPSGVALVLLLLPPRHAHAHPARNVATRLQLSSRRRAMRCCGADRRGCGPRVPAAVADAIGTRSPPRSADAAVSLHFAQVSLVGLPEPARRAGYAPRSPGSALAARSASRAGLALRSPLKLTALLVGWVAAPRRLPHASLLVSVAAPPTVRLAAVPPSSRLTDPRRPGRMPSAARDCARSLRGRRAQGTESREGERRHADSVAARVGDDVLARRRFLIVALRRAWKRPTRSW